MKETEIEIPAGCEVEKIETQDGHVVVTFKESERILPKTWEEFCKMFPIKDGECYIENYSNVIDARGPNRYKLKDKNVLPDRATAEAVLALCQLIQMRDCYNGDWVPDCNKVPKPYTIDFADGEIRTTRYDHLHSTPLYFKTAELRDEFLENFGDLIEKLKPIYGIKEGGDNE